MLVFLTINIQLPNMYDDSILGAEWIRSCLVLKSRTKEETWYKIQANRHKKFTFSAGVVDFGECGLQLWAREGPNTEAYI